MATSVYWLRASPADINAPTVQEIMAGTNISCAIVTDYVSREEEEMAKLIQQQYELSEGDRLYLEANKVQPIKGIIGWSRVWGEEGDLRVRINVKYLNGTGIYRESVSYDAVLDQMYKKEKEMASEYKIGKFTFREITGYAAAQKKEKEMELPREIKFEDIRVGDKIKASHTVRELVHDVTGICIVPVDSAIQLGSSWTLRSYQVAEQGYTFTLLERPLPKPKLGSVWGDPRTGSRYVALENGFVRAYGEYVKVEFDSEYAKSLRPVESEPTGIYR